MAQTPQEVVERIGREYVRSSTSVPEHPDVVDAFETMGKINRELYDRIPVPVVHQSDDPYDDYADMRDTVTEESQLRVFDGGSPHPIWDHETEVKSRAVHDWFGHLALDVDFSPTGEYRKWEHCRRHYPAHCARVFFTEVVGQLGAVHHLEDGFGDPRFQQKVFPASVYWIEDMSRAVEAYDD